MTIVPLLYSMCSSHHCKFSARQAVHSKLGSPFQVHAQFATGDAGSVSHIFDFSIPEQKAPCRLFDAVSAAKIGFSFEAELLAILEDDTFFLPFKVLYALDQLLGSAAETRKRKAPEGKTFKCVSKLP